MVYLLKYAITFNLNLFYKLGFDIISSTYYTKTLFSNFAKINSDCLCVGYNNESWYLITNETSNLKN